MRTGAVVLVLAVLLSVAPAEATDLNFSGHLDGSCILSLPIDGALGLSTDGDILGTEEGSGHFGQITIVAVGTNTISVTKPAWVAKPGGYIQTGESLEVAYSSALALLDAHAQDYTTQDTQFTVSGLPVAALIVNARATNAANGFVNGDYTMKVTVTCSAGSGG